MAAKKKPYQMKVVTDPVTGWAVLSGGPNAPTLTSEEVKAILENDAEHAGVPIGPVKNNTRAVRLPPDVLRAK